MLLACSIFFMILLLLLQYYGSFKYRMLTHYYLMVIYLLLVGIGILELLGCLALQYIVQVKLKYNKMLFVVVAGGFSCC